MSFLSPLEVGRAVLFFIGRKKTDMEKVVYLWPVNNLGSRSYVVFLEKISLVVDYYTGGGLFVVLQAAIDRLG